MKTRKVKLSMSDEWVIHLEFWCPGCRDIHSVPVSASTGPAGFCWNGKMSKPTIWPPVVIDSKSTLSGCVFTITDGVMKFAEWCTHEYAGKEYAEDYDWINPPRATIHLSKLEAENLGKVLTNPPSGPNPALVELFQQQREGETIGSFKDAVLMIGDKPVGELKRVTVGGRVIFEKEPLEPALDGVAVIDLSPRAPDPLEQMIDQGIFERREDGQLIMPFKIEEAF